MGLTAIEVQKAKAREKAYKMYDGDGLFLLVAPSGGKLWRLKYVIAGKEKQMALGSFPEITIAMARDRAIDARRSIATGIDPMAQKKAQKQAQANSFESVAWKWFDVWKHGKSARTVQQQEIRLKSNVLPHIGSRPIAEIEVRELVEMATAIEKRSPQLARRALHVVGQVYRYAIPHSLASRNPARDLNPGDFLKALTTSNQPRVDAKEVRPLLDKIDNYGNDQTRFALRLLALVALRPFELAGARWSEIDFDAARWDVPASRTKMRRDHIVPLSRQAVAILHQLREQTRSEFVFPGMCGKKGHMSSGSLGNALRKMGYTRKQCAHGFRGLASTILNEHGSYHGFDRAHIELQLAHVEGGVAGRYNKAEYLEQRKRMMQWYADYLDAQQHGAKVIPFAS